ncbi:MAG TPA: PAS domain S-box protein [Chloroflexia bacterium]|nr:PAS domain S-box protein [Chloroflexia bacterium]
MPRLSLAGERARLVVLVLLALLPAFGLTLYVVITTGSHALLPIFAALATVTLFALLAVWLGSERIVLRRVRALERASERLASGDMGVRSGLPHNGGELERLAAAFDYMANLLEDRTLKLQHEEAKFRTTLERAPVVTYAYLSSPGDGNTTLYVSPQIEQMLGFSPAEWMGDAELWSRQLHAEDRERVLAGYAHSCSTGEPFRLDYRLMTKAKHTVWVRDEARFTADQAGGSQFMHGILLDITDRKRAEDAMRSSQGSLAGIIDVAQDAIISVDQAQNIRLFNKGAEKIFGYSAQEVVGRPLAALLPQRFGEAHYAHVAQFMQSSDTSRQMGENLNILGRRKDGSEFPVEASISKLETKGDKILTVMLRDITARKQVERALRASEQSFRLMFKGNPLPMWVYDLDTLQFLEVNDAATARYGYSREEFLRMRITDIRPHEDVPRLVDNAKKEGSDLHYSMQWKHRLKDGQVIDVQVVSHTLEFAGKHAALVVAEDITERKIAEEALRDSEKRFRAVFEGAGIGVALIDIDGRITETNQALQSMLGYAPEELCLKSFLELSHPDDAPLHAYRFNEMIEGRTTYYQMEKRYFRGDGSIVWANLTVSAVRRRKGRPQFSVAMIENITERKRSQEQIKRQLERLAALRNIDMAISASLDLRVTLNVILDQVTSQLHIDAADVLLLNPHTQMLEYAAGRGFRHESVARSRLRLGESYAGRAALQRRTLSVSNLLDTDDLLRAPLLADEAFISYYAVPLLVKGQVKGVLEIFHRARFEADPEWLDFLEALAGQAALAIDNATLFDDLQRSNVELALAYDTTLEGWSRALDLRDKETEGHTRRVTEMTMRLARFMGVSEADLVHVHRGALLHDIGKMGIPDSILLKPGSLTNEEWDIMRRHPVYAYELLSPITFLRPALDIPYCHHEKWDGTGYPRGLKGEQIPIAARIFAIIDVWDALTSDRPYRKAWAEPKVLEHIRSLSGTHFDPQVVRAFVQMNVSTFKTMPLDGLLEFLEQKDLPTNVPHSNGKAATLLPK